MGASAALIDHAMETSLAAEGLARQIHFFDPDLAFLASLMQDIRQMVLLQSNSDRFGQLLDQTKLNPNDGMVTGPGLEALRLDDCKIGAAVLYRCDIDSTPGPAVLTHNADTPSDVSVSSDIIL